MRLSSFLKDHPIIKKEYVTVGNWIRDGQVKVDGNITYKNIRVNPNHAQVELFQSALWQKLPYTNPNLKILLFYKPRDYLCTHSDPFGRKIVYDLLPQEFRQFRSAGRLDQDSEGLMVFSNDGFFLHSISHPSQKCTKVYLVGLLDNLPDSFFEKAKSGDFVIEHNEVVFDLQPCLVQPIQPENKTKFNFLGLESNFFWYEFHLQEGKTNQIRKMCMQFDNEVQRLIRIQQGKYELNQNLIIPRLV
jgi:pseudouridine synthase